MDVTARGRVHQGPVAAPADLDDPYNVTVDNQGETTPGTQTWLNGAGSCNATGDICAVKMDGGAVRWSYLTVTLPDAARTGRRLDARRGRRALPLD